MSTSGSATPLMTPVDDTRPNKPMESALAVFVIVRLDIL